jgi:hypothetical protein
MQWTEPAGKLLVVREPAPCRLGTALAEHLRAEDFPEDWVNANPEEAKRRIIEAFERVEGELSADGQRFGEKIRVGELPAAASGR